MSKQESGFTIVELVVSLLVLGVLLAFAIPSYQGVIASNALRTSTADLITALNLAKMQSVSLRQQVTVAPVTAGDWESGWVVTYPAGSEEKNQTFLPAQDVAITQTQGANNPVFRSDGYTTNTPAAFQLCNPKAGDTGRLISVSVVGRISNEDVDCNP
ncbi:MAG: GspH/FimT family pseudopilin [Pseudomonadales bacterium]|uniref:Type II secretion system protein H n=1 Tax=Alcanivorax profundi TaxID=2338368 RepID=A0A418XTF6_9GAMM|nr:MULTISPECIES: GspH/FimT family pseudopilin [Alcanivorax]ERP86869.1 hypothetical protein Q670_04605 [Alcanivorax sp. P2S70]MCG8415799.1 GspH/FimT family pseudopilin [Pseudomonadales bacterium]RJG15966.1 prepilin-type N-terminal cleavage/methylation domain-containing protein [Alcanivorax profundi]